jgi:hypothetical protein
VRAIDCPCGHRLEGADDNEPVRLAREQVDSHHPDSDRSVEAFGNSSWRARRMRVTARGLEGSEWVLNARVGGATPLWEWIGDGATVFSY